MDPIVTVLMTVYNGEPYLRTSVESILNQTFGDFEFLIIDDASDDDTIQKIRSYNDPRIRLVLLDKNVGQTAALNIGLKLVRTPWIARMDADDCSAPTRLEEQMEAIRLNPTLCCIGTFAWVFREDPAVVEEILTRPTEDAEIKRVMLREPSIIHGSFIVSRKAILEAGGYDERYRYSADFDLYERLVTPEQRVANIPKPLLGIRRHDNQGSRSIGTTNEGIEIYLRRLADPRYSAEEKKMIRGSLSFYYLLKARHRLRQRQFQRVLIEDVVRALRLSPSTFLSHLHYGVGELFKVVRRRGI